MGCMQAQKKKPPPEVVRIPIQPLPPPAPIVIEPQPDQSPIAIYERQSSAVPNMDSIRSLMSSLKIEPSAGKLINETHTEKLLFHVNPKSVMLHKESDRNYSLTFSLDTKIPWFVEVHQASIEVLNEQNQFLQYYTDLSKYPAAVRFQVPAQMNQQFPRGVLIIDTTQIPEEICLNKYEAVFPITIVVIDEENLDPTIKQEATFVYFSKKENQYQAEVDKQKCYFDGQPYELDQVYTMADDFNVEAQECCICLWEVPSVLLLPCRHLWLWGSKACRDTLKQDGEELCPICRKGIAEYVSVSD